MQTLVKYVLVTESGGWLAMVDDRAGAAELAWMTPGARVERWTYPLLEDGTHGTPAKERC